MKLFSRTASFWIVAIVYCLAAIVGIAVFLRLPYGWQLTLLIADAAADTVLFLSVSIPMADKRQSAKSGFAEYRKQTRKLLPIPKNIR